MKKGEMTIPVLVAIIIGIVVLVFLIFGFSTGWSNMWDKISNYGGGSANVDTIKTSCQLACSQNAIDAWCNQERTVKFGSNVATFDGTNIVTADKTLGTCDKFKKETRYNVAVDGCSSITCVGLKKCSDYGEKAVVVAEDKCVLNTNTVLTSSQVSDLKKGEVCCVPKTTTTA